MTINKQGIIKKLDKNLIPKIAAGEVVDRPSSAIKELIDNSIDAKSTTITIILKDAGKSLIKIIDNGFGMSKSDLLKCYLPFTTSKISTEDDLNNILSHGFRGEALNSISSISKINIKSKMQNTEHGNELQINGGELNYIKPTGINDGTIVTINDLYYNVPARKSFLKSSSTELKNIIKLVENYALSNINISFKLINNNKTLIDVKKSKSIENRIIDILKIDSSNLLQINSKDDYVNLFGYIGNPNLSSYVKNNYLFVNKRYVENKDINKSIKKAYGTLLEHSSNPFSILFIDLMPSLVNVNIHPQKKEVAFFDDKKVNKIVFDNVKNVLNKKLVKYDTDFFGKSINKASSYQFNYLKNNNFAWNTKGIEEPTIYQDMFQIDNTYIVSQTNKGLLLIDQHAAHESILYEQFIDSYLNTKLDTQTLDINLLLELPQSIKSNILDNNELLNKIGFEFSDFGRSTLKVVTIPKIFKDHDIKKLLQELLQTIEDKGNFDQNFVDTKTQQTISFLACRSAIKAGDVLTKQEMKNLCIKLDESKGYLTCPHGRPTKIILSPVDLQKIFKRI